MIAWLPRLIARIPASIHSKLLAAFLGIVVMFVALGTVGLLVLRGADQRAAELVDLQRKITAYRQLQHNTTEQLYALTSALVITDRRTLDATLRQLSQFAYDFDRAQFVAGADRELIESIKADYTALIETGSQMIELIRSGQLVEAQKLQRKQAIPISDRLKRQTYTLINKAETEMVSSADLSNKDYQLSQWVLGGVALAGVLLALLMGYALSRSLTVPVQGMHQRFRGIAQGDFTEQLTVANRDELGELVSGLNRMSGELDRLYHQLELVSQHKSQFLANMSHELRTPLNAILGYTELIADEIYGPVPEKIKEVLERVEHNGRHLLGLINAVLDLSKIEAGRLSLELNEYSLREVIFEAVTTVESLAAEKGLALQATLPDDIPLARGDAPRLKQVLLNLLGNAIKFTDTGEVKVLTRIDADRFTVAVSDTGPGIAPEQQAHIFEEFQQVDNSITREKGGSGLGLAIAKKIIELHGGEIGVESEPGRGSTFWFQVPINVLQQQEAA